MGGFYCEEMQAHHWFQARLQAGSPVVAKMQIPPAPGCHADLNGFRARPAEVMEKWPRAAINSYCHC